MRRKKKDSGKRVAGSAFIILSSVPFCLAAIFFLLATKPADLPKWAYVLLPLVPLLIFVWWIMHRSEQPYGR